MGYFKSSESIQSSNRALLGLEFRSISPLAASKNDKSLVPSLGLRCLGGHFFTVSGEVVPSIGWFVGPNRPKSAYATSIWPPFPWMETHLYWNSMILKPKHVSRKFHPHPISLQDIIFPCNRSIVVNHGLTQDFLPPASNLRCIPREKCESRA